MLAIGPDVTGPCNHTTLLSRQNTLLSQRHVACVSGWRSLSNVQCPRSTTLKTLKMGSRGWFAQPPALAARPPGNQRAATWTGGARQRYKMQCAIQNRHSSRSSAPAQASTRKPPQVKPSQTCSQVLHGMGQASPLCGMHGLRMLQLPQLGPCLPDFLLLGSTSTRRYIPADEESETINSPWPPPA